MESLVEKETKLQMMETIDCTSMNINRSIIEVLI